MICEVGELVIDPTMGYTIVRLLHTGDKQLTLSWQRYGGIDGLLVLRWNYIECKMSRDRLFGIDFFCLVRSEPELIRSSTPETKESDRKSFLGASPWQVKSSDVSQSEILKCGQMATVEKKGLYRVVLLAGSVSDHKLVGVRSCRGNGDLATQELGIPKAGFLVI